MIKYSRQMNAIARANLSQRHVIIKVRVLIRAFVQKGKNPFELRCTFYNKNNDEKTLGRESSVKDEERMR